MSTMVRLRKKREKEKPSSTTVTFIAIQATTEAYSCLANRMAGVTCLSNIYLIQLGPGQAISVIAAQCALLQAIADSYEPDQGPRQPQQPHQSATRLSLRRSMGSLSTSASGCARFQTVSSTRYVTYFVRLYGVGERPCHDATLKEQF